MAREQFTLEILADIQKATTPIQKIVQLLRVFDEGQVVDVVTSPNLDAAVQKINELSAAATRTREQAGLLAAEFRTATSSLNLGTVGTDQARQLADTFKLDTERFREFRNLVKAGAKDIGLDPNSISGFQTFDQTVTQVQNKIRALSSNLTKFGFNERTLTQAAEINQLIADLTAKFPGLRSAVEQQLTRPFAGSSVAVREVAQSLDLLKSADAFAALQSEATNLGRRLRELKATADSIDASGGVLDEKSAQNFANATAKADQLAQRIASLKAARAQANLLGIDPAQISQIDNTIAQLESRLARIRTSIDANAASANRWDQANKGIVSSTSIIERLTRDLTAARKSNSAELDQETRKLVGIGAQIDRLRQAEQSRGGLSAKEGRELAKLEAQYNAVAKEVIRLRELQKSLNTANVFGKQINDLQNLREQLLNNQKVTKDFRAAFKRLTGERLPTDNAKAYTEALQRLNLIVSELRRNFPDAAAAAAKLNAANISNGQTFSRLQSNVKDFNFFMSIAIEKIIRYRIAFIALQRSVQAIQSTFTVARDIESAFANIEKVTLGTAVSIDTLRQSAFTLGREFGRSIKDITDVMFIWAQQGKSQNDILKLTEATMVGVVGANLDAQQAVETLTSAQKVYNLTAEESLSVFDKLLNVQRQFAVTTKDLADALKLLGTTASEFGVDMDLLFGQITAVVQVTRKTGQQVANSLKTIFAKFLQTDSVEALRDIGVAVFDLDGAVRPLGDTLDELAEKWDTLTSTQRLNIARLVGGIRHYTQFLVLMDQYPTALEAAAKSQQSAGFALRATSIELDTVANQVERVKAIFTEFGNAVGSATFGLVNQVRAFADSVETIRDVVGDAFGPGGLRAVSEFAGALLFLGETFFLIGAAKFAATLAATRYGDQLVGRVLPSLVVVETSAKKLNDQLAAQGVLAADAALTTIGATEAELRSIARKASALKGTQVLTAAVGAETIKLAIGQNILRTSVDAATGAIATNGLILDATGKAILTTSAATAGWQARLGALTGFLGGPWTVAIGTLVSVLGFLALRQLDVTKNFKLMGEAADESLGDMVGLTNNLGKLASIAATSTVKAINLVEKLQELQAAGKDTSGVMRELTGVVNSLGFDERLRNFSLGNLLGSDGGAAAEELLGILTQLVVQYGEEFAIAQARASARLVRVKNDAEAYKQVLFGVAEEEKNLELARAQVAPLISDINIKFAKDYTRRLDEVNRAINKQLVLVNALGQDGAKETQALIEAEKEYKRLLGERRNLSKELADETKALTAQFQPLANAAAEFLDTVLESGDANLISKLLGEDPEVARRSAFAIAFDIGQVISETIAQYGSVNVDQIIQGVPALKAAIDAQTNFGAETDNTAKKIQDVSDALTKLRGVAELALTFTQEEFDKLNDRLAKFAAAAQVSFNDLEATISDAIDAASAKGEKTTFFDIVIKETEKSLSLITDTTDALKKQIKQAEINAEIQRRLAQDRLLYNAAAFETQVAQRDELKATLEAAAAARGVTIDGLTATEELSRAYGAQVTRLYQLEQAVASYGYQLQLAEPRTDVFAETAAWVEQLKQDGTLTAEAASALNAQLKAAPQILQRRIDQLERELELAEDITSEAYNSQKADLEKYRVQKLILEAEKARARLVAENAQKDIGVLGTVLAELDRSTSATTKTLELQSAEYDKQVKLAEAVAAATALGNNETFDHAQLIRDVIEGQLEWEDVLSRITEAYINQDAALENQTRELEGQREIIESQYRTTKERLNTEIAIANVLQSHENSLQRANELTQFTGNIRTQLASVFGDTNVALQEEARLLQLSAEEYRNINSAVEAAKETTAQFGDAQNGVVNALSNNVGVLNEEFSNSVAIVENELQQALANLQPYLVDMTQLAGSIADAFASAFSGINETLVGRFEAIADQEDKILEKTRDINYLTERLGSVADTSSDEYKSIKQEIIEAEVELANMNREMDRLSNAGKIAKEVFGDFAKSLADLVVDVQTDSLKRAIEQALTKTSIGKTITDAFLDGSQIAAREIVKNLLDGFATIDETTARAFKLSGQQLSTQMVVALLTGGDAAAKKLDASFNLFLLKWSKINNIQVEDDFLRSISEPLSAEDINRVVDRLEARSTAITSSIETQQQEMVSSLRTLVAQMNQEIAASEDLKVGIGLLRAAVPLIAKNLGTILSTQVFGASSAAGASTGGSLGGLFGNLLTNTNAQGQNLFGKLFGKGAGTFAASELGGLLISGLGTIAGSLLGGLLGKRDEPIEELRAPLADLGEETKKNTEAIRQLNSTFDDLRSELINAPSRFVLPSQATLGGRVDGGGAGGISTPVNGLAGGTGLTVNFNGIQNFDSSAANDAVRQISELYDRQRRTGASNRVLRR